MDLKRKLSNLFSAGPGARVVDPVSIESVEATIDEVNALVPDATDRSRIDRITELRSRIQAMMAKPAAPRKIVPRELREDILPFIREESEHGPIHSRTRVYDTTQRHGNVPLHVALDAHGDSVATLALDPKLRSFVPERALYLDTETTGLSGGTGTLAFLIGIASFNGRDFRCEQLFLSEPSEERAMLTRLAERIESASAIVSYNGKSFDMPLLRSRFIMARMTPPPEPPHLDLVHIARRIYGERLAQCKLTTLERDVLGFVREGDVPSGEIPARYASFLRTGDPSGLLMVIDHNLWDVIAMAALVGELAARMVGLDSAGRFEPADMAGLARTALRAGEDNLAVSLARSAASRGARAGQSSVASRAHAFAAGIFRRRKDHGATRDLLLEALALEPSDGSIHLALTKLYEHKLRDPVCALEHAKLSWDVEDDEVHARRIRRLEKRIKRLALPLPGIKLSG